MNLRSDRGSTSARAGHGLGEGQRESGWGNEHNNGGSHEVPLLAPPPLPPPPLMTHAEMMVEMLAAHRMSAHAMELLEQAIGGFAVEATEEMVGTGVVPAVPRDPTLTKNS